VSERSQAASASPWRLIVDPPADGAWNMAVDEAILEGYERDGASRAPTLRLYGWDPAAISLGRSQPAPSSRHAATLAAGGIDLVRRPTGGEAVLHEIERTYAVVGTLGDSTFDRSVVATYKTIATALTAGLATLGVATVAVAPRRDDPRRVGAACFERIGAWELSAGGRKLVGSAQARRRTAFLQHGSIPIRLHAERLSSVLGTTVDGSRFTDLTRAARRDVDPAAVDRALVRGFEEALGVRLVLGSLTEAEALRAAELRCWKYDSMAWTRDGRIGAREARWGPAIQR
jgi:lipoate-protein ligase A